MNRVVIGPDFIIDVPNVFGNYQYVKYLGQGTSGVVILARSVLTNEEYAVKIISRDFLLKSRSVERFQHEVTITSSLRHVNIIKLIEMISNEELIFIVMEYCSRGDLYQLIIQQGCFPEPVARSIFGQILSAIDFLHLNGIAHRDLKPENILLDKNLNVKIGDFGFAKPVDDHNELMTTQCGSPIYTAPEIISGQPYDGMQSDMWSLGVILFVLLTGKIPWENSANFTQLFFQIQTAKFHIPDFVSPMARDLINNLLQPQPSMRLTVVQAKTHPWIADFITRSKSNQTSMILSTCKTDAATKHMNYSSHKLQRREGNITIRQPISRTRINNLHKQVVPITERHRGSSVPQNIEEQN